MPTFHVSSLAPFISFISVVFPFCLHSFSSIAQPLSPHSILLKSPLPPHINPIFSFSPVALYLPRLFSWGICISSVWYAHKSWTISIQSSRLHRYPACTFLWLYLFFLPWLICSLLICAISLMTIWKFLLFSAFSGAKATCPSFLFWFWFLHKKHIWFLPTHQSHIPLLNILTHVY